MPETITVESKTKQTHVRLVMNFYDAKPEFYGRGQHYWITVKDEESNSEAVMHFDLEQTKKFVERIVTELKNNGVVNAEFSLS